MKLLHKRFFSNLELKLLYSHDVFYIRGNKGQAVPVFVPPDMKNLMTKLVEDPLKIGSQYLLDSPKDSSKVVISAQDSLDKYVSKAGCD